MKKIMSVLIAGAMALGLTACGGGGNEAGNSDRANSMYTWLSNDADRQQWQSFVDGVKEEVDPDFELEMEGPNYLEYWTLVRTRLSSSDAPCIITTQAARSQELAEILTPLDELIAEAGFDISAYNAAMVKGMTVDGTVRAIPYDAAPSLIFYNKTRFEEKGLPLPGATYTREQFLSDAHALTSDGHYAIFLGADPTHPFVPYTFANRVTPTKDGKLELTDDAFVDEIQWMFDLVYKEGVAAAPDPGETDGNGRAELLAGNVAMTQDGPWSYSSIIDEANFDVGLTIPASDSGEAVGMINGSGFGIADSCPDKKAAFENILKMVSPEVIGYVAEHRGIVPALPEVMDKWSEGKPQEHIEVLEALLENGMPLEAPPNWNVFVTQFTQYSPEGVRGAKTAREILTSIQQSLGD